MQAKHINPVVVLYIVPPYNVAFLQERERDSMEELEEAKQQAQTATHAFNAVRQARYDTFMKAFNHISAGIDQIFKVSSMACLFPSVCSTYLVHLGQHLKVSRGNVRLCYYLL